MAYDPKIQDKEHSATDAISQITQALKGIQFGSVEIIIHESRVVQIERKEKLRFDRRTTLDRNTNL